MRRINIATPQFEYDTEDPTAFAAAWQGSKGPAGAHGVRNETDATVRRESKVGYFDGEA